MKPEPSPWERSQAPLKRILRTVRLILVQSLLSWILYSLVAITFKISPKILGNNQNLLTVQELVKLLISILSIYLVLKISEDQNLSHIGAKFSKQTVPDFIFGFFLPFVAIGLGFLLLLGVKWIRINGFAWQSKSDLFVVENIFIAIFLFALVGLNEELISRGFHLQIIERGSNRLWGVFLSSVIFVCLHLDNLGVTWFGFIFIFFTSLLMSYAYLKTGQLWLSMGLHAGWDFFKIVLFYGSPGDDVLQTFHLLNLMQEQASS
jgi:membrane protease YdiL (CAAX protease family)